jgi:hypothetical protein
MTITDPIMLQVIETIYFKIGTNHFESLEVVKHFQLM